MIEPFETEKQCTKCMECKPLSAFGRDPRKKDGRITVCKACRSMQNREWYQSRKARGIERKREPVVKLEPLWTLPTHTLSDGLSCVHMRKWRGPVQAGTLRASP